MGDLGEDADDAFILEIPAKNKTEDVLRNSGTSGNLISPRGTT